MPFDVATETPLIRRHVLVEALRGKIPDRVEWDFSTVYEKHDCKSVVCALGWASLIWPEHAPMLRSYDSKRQARFFGLSEDDARRIFWDDGPCSGIFYRSGNPRPKTVARALEAAAFVEL